MTDEHYRAINRALCLIEGDEIDEFQDIREAARTALHHIFGREKKLRDRLRVYEGDDHNDGRDPYIRDLKAELAKLREQLDALEENGPPPTAVQFKALMQERDRLREREKKLREMVEHNFEEAEKVPGLLAENINLREALLKIASMIVPAALAEEGYRELQAIARNALKETT